MDEVTGGHKVVTQKKVGTHEKSEENLKEYVKNNVFNPLNKSDLKRLTKCTLN